MSHVTNTEWVEGAKENFDTFVEEGNYQGCLDVIHDMFEKGFEAESRQLRELLRAVPASRFIHTSPIQAYDL